MKPVPYWDGLARTQLTLTLALTLALALALALNPNPNPNPNLEHRVEPRGGLRADGDAVREGRLPARRRAEGLLDQLERLGGGRLGRRERGAQLDVRVRVRVRV